MEKASRIMYSIANIFNWFIAIFAIIGIIFSTIGIVGRLPDGVDAALFTTPMLVYYIIVLLLALLVIFLVRKAKSKRSSKAWDILFIVIGVIEMNPFYILGGIFGVVAAR